MNTRGTSVAVVARHDDSTSYPMYEAQALTPKGFFLAGSLFLEVDEELTVEFALDGGSHVRTRVRVERVDHGSVPGMAVLFAELSDSDREKLEGLLGANDG